MIDFYRYDFNSIGRFTPPPVVVPNRITGVGRMKYRGPDKKPKNAHKAKHTATRMKKQSRRRNRKK